jgi:prepilin-type processing-associated H-X9-DG protein
VAKSDYAINGGSGAGWDRGAGGTGGSPSASCLEENELSSGVQYPNCDWHIWPSAEYWQKFNGVSGWRIGANASQISDGVSKTILVGEKFIQPMFYENSCPLNGAQPSKGNAGDNGAMYLGWDIDIARTGKLARDFNAANPSDADNSQFGAAHPHAANFSFCDGSVRSIRYDAANFVRFVTRNDADLPSLQ